MRLRNLGLALIAICLGACSNENINNSDIDEKGNAFLSLNIAMPNSSSSRAIAEGDGYEYGEPDENKVNEVLVLLYGTDDAFVTSKLYAVGELTYAKNDNTAANADYVNTYKTPSMVVKAGTYKMVAIVNPLAKYKSKTPSLAELKAATEENVLNLTTDENGSRFVMMNSLSGVGTDTPTSSNGAATTDYYIDGTVKVTLAAGNETEATVNVERSIAKIRIEMPGENGLMSVEGEGNTDKVQFLGYCVVNQNRLYYPMKTVESGNTNNDYIVDPNFNNFDIKNITNDWMNENFIKESRNIRGIYTPFAAKNSVYCMENTNEKDHQIEGTTTKVYFKAHYMANGEKAFKHLYRYKGVVYTSFAELQTKAGVNLENLKFNGVKMTEKIYNDADEATLYSYYEIDQLERYGIIVYNGGICFYPYKIVHRPSTTNNDVMKYAVVRNNVYALSIASVSGIGRGLFEDTTDYTPNGNPDSPDYTDVPKYDPTKPETLTPTYPTDTSEKKDDGNKPVNPGIPTDPDDPITTQPKDDEGITKPISPVGPHYPSDWNGGEDTMGDTDANLKVNVNILKWTVRKNNINL